MKSWKRSFASFGMGYVIATGVGAATFRNPALMWGLTFTVVSFVFAVLAYWYFCGVKPSKSEARREAIKLITLWVVVSFALDALVYIAGFPLAFGAKPNWTFFVDQSPWIWLCYAILVPLIFGGLHAYQRGWFLAKPATGV